MSKLSRVLLVDDYAADNFMNQMLLEELDCAEQIDIATNGRLALNYLTTEVDGDYPRPELILLDINMPVMNGWEFLDAYHQLPSNQDGAVVLMMLTTSLNPDDEAAANRRSDINEFVTKPLSRDVLCKLLLENFPGRFPALS